MNDRLKRIFDQPPSRNELLKLGGNFTVSELREFGLGQEKEDYVSNVGRELLYINDVVPVRLIPNSLLSLAENLLEETADIGQVIEPIWTSFYVFRVCVNKELEVPLVKKEDGVWEWPEPTDFAWGDENTKTLALMFGAYGRQNEASVSVVEGNTIHKLSVSSGTVSEKKVSDLVAHPEKHIKYKIPVLNDVRMINQQAWQIHALRNWAGRNHLASAFSNLINQSLDRKKAEGYFLSMIDVLSQKTLDMPVVRYAKEGERDSMDNLFILEF